MTRWASPSTPLLANRFWRRSPTVAVAGAPSTPFIDWSLFARIILVSIVAGVALVVAFSIGLAALSFARGVGRSGAARALGVTLTVLMGATIVGALLWGLELIVKKS